jgi:hypothetical protein
VLLLRSLPPPFSYKTLVPLLTPNLLVRTLENASLSSMGSATNSFDVADELTFSLDAIHR